jgi:formylglycine-generating enzyme required for sulfatase activity
MEGAMTPQQAIARGLAKPSECDLVVAILWSRLGTPLPPEYRKPDGSPYASGTEWEILDGLDRARAVAPPAYSVWIYRRTEAPSPSFEDRDYEEKRGQWQRLREFLASPLIKNPDGSLRTGVNSYATPSAFRVDFEEHLRDRLTELLQAEGEAVASAAQPAEAEPAEPQWEGAPYPGLEAFKPWQAPIFFGRSAETDQLVKTFADSEVRFVCVVGASGSGKSSLVAAGLLPRLAHGAVPGSEHWAQISFGPGERGGDPFLALAYPLKETLGLSGTSPEAVSQALRNDSKALETVLQRNRRDAQASGEQLLFVDQFEELWQVQTCTTGTGEGHENELVRRIEDFIALLDRAAHHPTIRVVASMRSEFYDRAAGNEVLAALLRGRGTFTLAAPGRAAMRQMIVRPAALSGVTVGRELVERLLDDTARESGGLALLAYSLAELFRRSANRRELSLVDYQAIGGVEGAIREQATASLRPYQTSLDRLLPRLFRDLVVVDERDVAFRRRADLKALQGDPESETAMVVRALIDARLLVTGGEEQAETVEVAHEKVFSAWPPLQRWIKDNADDLRLVRRLEQAASDWGEAGRPRFTHLPDRAVLKGYREVAARMTVDARGRAFVTAASRRLLLLRGVVAMAVGAILVLGTGNLLQSQRLSWKALGTWTLATLRLYPGPEMVAIRPGEPIPGRGGEIFPASFKMGSDDGREDERPVHEVVPEAFAIGRYEVTFDQYSAFALSDPLHEVPADQNWGRGRRPVIMVSWDDALSFTEWLNEHKPIWRLGSAQQYRLPSESEWEYAARGGTDTVFWWSNRIDEKGGPWANCQGCGSRWDGDRTAPVGQLPTNPFGLHDTAGNVWEWTQDCWHETYQGAARPDDGRAWEAEDGGDCERRVGRGGSWLNSPRHFRSAFRYWSYRGFRSIDVGFRLAQDLP